MKLTLTPLIEPVHYALQDETDADNILGMIVFLDRHCSADLLVRVDEQSVAITLVRPPSTPTGEAHLVHDERHPVQWG
jgi:hypothetical protein